jgi:hypothetical protein
MSIMRAARPKVRLRGMRPLAGMLRAGLAVALGLACLAGQLATVAHELTSLHVTCAEHGEVMDAPVEQAHEAERFSPSPAIHRGADPVHDKGHEHCVLAVHARHHAATPSPQAHAVLAAASAARAPVASVTAPPAAIARYRLAPKTSPPV